MISTCNRVELYVAADDARSRGRRAGRGAGAAGRRRGRRSRRAPLSAPRRGGRPPPVPGRVQPRFAGGGRAADPRPDQAGATTPPSSTARPGAVLRACFEEGAFRVARRVRRETAIARNPVSVSSVAVEFARQVVGDFDEAPGADRRRGQDVGAGGAHAAHARRDADGHQPDARARRGAGAALRRRRRRLERSARRAGRGRHRHRVDRRAAAGADAGPADRRAEGAPRAPAVPDRHRASRATSIRRRASSTASTCPTSTTCRSRRASTAPSARKKRPRPRPSSSRSWARFVKRWRSRQLGPTVSALQAHFHGIARAEVQRGRPAASTTRSGRRASTCSESCVEEAAPPAADRAARRRSATRVSLVQAVQRLFALSPVAAVPAAPKRRAGTRRERSVGQEGRRLLSGPPARS